MTTNGADLLEVIETEVTLSDPEVRTLGADLAQVICDRQTVEQKRKEQGELYGKELKRLMASAGRIAAEIRLGKRLDNVECRKVYDYDQGSVSYLKTTNDEVLLVRSLRDDERQLVAPLEEHESV